MIGVLSSVADGAVDELEADVFSVVSVDEQLCSAGAVRSIVALKVSVCKVEWRDSGERSCARFEL